MTSWRENIIWAAGLFEGEGSLCWLPVRKPRRIYYKAQATLHMTDEDIVKRFQAAVGFGKVQGPYQYGNNRKPSWYWSAQSGEHVQALIAMFWPWLGDRRRTKAKELLQRIKTLSIAAAKDPATGRFIGAPV